MQYLNWALFIAAGLLLAAGCASSTVQSNDDDGVGDSDTATANSEALMRNIIARLAHPTLCSS